MNDHLTDKRGNLPPNYYDELGRPPKPAPEERTNPGEVVVLEGMDGGKLNDLIRAERQRKATPNPTAEDLANRNIVTTGSLKESLLRCGRCGNMISSRGDDMPIVDQNRPTLVLCYLCASPKQRANNLVEAGTVELCPTCKQVMP